MISSIPLMSFGWSCIPTLVSPGRYRFHCGGVRRGQGAFFFLAPGCWLSWEDSQWKLTFFLGRSVMFFEISCKVSRKKSKDKNPLTLANQARWWWGWAKTFENGRRNEVGDLFPFANEYGSKLETFQIHWNQKMWQRKRHETEGAFCGSMGTFLCLVVNPVSNSWHIHRLSRTII